MKKNLLKNSVFTLATVFAVGQANAQLIDGHAYMLGDYVEIAINANGHEGAPCVDTLDMHCRGGAGELHGFVANPQMDDWIEFNGDFFTPGSPENGNGAGYTLDDVVYNRANNAFGGLSDFDGEITDYTETTDSIIVTWIGDVDDLEMTLVYILKKDEHFYTTTVSFDNLGDEEFTDVYYYRNLDPDNNQPIMGSYVTTNTIVSQSEMSDDSVIVNAFQSVPWDVNFEFHAYGENWKGFTGGFTNRIAADMWNGTGDVDGTEGLVVTADQAIGIAYKIESLPPGKASSVTFSFASVFKKGALSDGVIDTDGINENNKLDIQLYPNPTTGETVTLVLEGNYTYHIDDIKGSTVQTGAGNGLTEINLNGMDKGIYFITIEQNNSIVSKKLNIK